MLVIIFTRRFIRIVAVMWNPLLCTTSPKLALGRLSSVGKRSWFRVAEHPEDAFDEAEPWHAVASALPSLKVGAFEPSKREADLC